MVMGRVAQPLAPACGLAWKRAGRASLPAYAPDHAGAKGEPDGRDTLQKRKICVADCMLRCEQVHCAAHTQSWVLPVA